MKLPCEIVQDLLFLYTDEACSPESKKAVEEHLSKCETCRKRLDAIKLPEAMVAETPEPEPEQQEQVMKNCFGKLRRRWVASVLAVLMLLPIALLTVMGVHEYRGQGVAFTNLDEIYISLRFFGLVQDGKFEQAVKMIDFDSEYQELQELLASEPEQGILEYFGAVADMTEEEFRTYMRTAVIQALEDCFAQGVSIRNLRYDYAYKIEDVWSIVISAEEQFLSGKSYRVKFDLVIRDGKIRAVSGNSSTVSRAFGHMYYVVASGHLMA